MTDSFDEDEFLESLGVEIAWPEKGNKKAKAPLVCGEKVPKVQAKRFTDWNNSASFESAGYLARVVQTTCNCCGSMRESFLGVFAVEVKIATGARRMQAAKQWPANGEHVCEVEQQFSEFCPDCIRELGFSKEVEAPMGQRELWVRE